MGCPPGQSGTRRSRADARARAGDRARRRDRRRVHRSDRSVHARRRRSRRHRGRRVLHLDVQPRRAARWSASSPSSRSSSWSAPATSSRCCSRRPVRVRGRALGGMAMGGDRARAAGAGDPGRRQPRPGSGEIALGIWSLGIAFPWLIGRAAARQQELALELDATRAELAKQALVAERRQIARDVHDVVGHGIAALMLQIISARHVLRRDPAAAEDALRSAEDVGRRSMQELRRTVAVLRRRRRAGGRAAAFGARDPGPGRGRPIGRSERRAAHARRSVADHTERRRRALRITQEALANATRHAAGANRVRTRGHERASVAVRRDPRADDRARRGRARVRPDRDARAGDRARRRVPRRPDPEGWLVSCRHRCRPRPRGAEEAPGR